MILQAGAAAGAGGPAGVHGGTPPAGVHGGVKGDEASLELAEGVQGGVAAVCPAHVPAGTPRPGVHAGVLDEGVHGGVVIGEGHRIGQSSLLELYGNKFNCLPSGRNQTLYIPYHHYIWTI